LLFSPIAMEYNVPPPIPIKSAMEIITEKTGTAIFTLASAIEPTPFPTKIPSMTIFTDINIMPSNVSEYCHRRYFCWEWRWFDCARQCEYCRPRFFCYYLHCTFDRNGRWHVIFHGDGRK